MAGLPRTRYQRSVGVLSQRWEHTYNGETVSEGETFDQYDRSSRYCQDVVGNRDFANPLVIITDRQESIPYSIALDWVETIGDQQIPVTTRFNGATANYYLPYGPVVSDVEFVTKAVAETNPSAADFDIPIFIGELRDVPSLLKNASERLSKAGADELLKFEYGWKPLVSDIRKMTRFMEHLHRKVGNLRKLEHNHSITRVYRPPASESETIIFDPSVLYDWGLGNAWPGYSDLYSIKGEGRVTIQRWCTVKWAADKPEGLPSVDDDLMKLALRASGGLTVDGSTAWELMPWSWLIDWNTNMSDYLGSKRNIVGASPVEICLMKTTSYYASTYLVRNGIAPPPGVTLDSCVSTPGFTQYVSKERLIDIEPAAITTGEINLLGGDVRKQSILSALSIQRLQRLKPPRL